MENTFGTLWIKSVPNAQADVKMVKQSIMTTASMQT